MKMTTETQTRPIQGVREAVTSSSIKSEADKTTDPPRSIQIVPVEAWQNIGQSRKFPD
jgi:hypothetical protein